MKTISRTISLRDRRARRVRSKVFGTEERPRLAVFKSNTTIYVQIINDDAGRTITAASSKGLKGTPLKKAAEVGTTIATLAIKEGVKKVVFDRGGFHYIGAIKVLADAARAGGLIF